MRLATLLVLTLIALTACREASEDVAVESQPVGEESVEPEVTVGESTALPEPDPPQEVVVDPGSHSADLESVQPTTESESDEGPFRLSEDIERPRRLGNPGPIEGLVAMMRSGDYAWGSCIFQVTISETGEVGEVVVLKPEDLAAEVEEVVSEGFRQWRFSPATRAGEPVAVYYNLVIHHCPLFRKDREN